MFLTCSNVELANLNDPQNIREQDETNDKSYEKVKAEADKNLKEIESGEVSEE